MNNYERELKFKGNKNTFSVELFGYETWNFQALDYVTKLDHWPIKNGNTENFGKKVFGNWETDWKNWREGEFILKMKYGGNDGLKQLRKEICKKMERGNEFEKGMSFKLRWSSIQINDQDDHWSHHSHLS